MKSNTNYFYLAKPVYGGWVTFTAHLLHKLNVKTCLKISSRMEKNVRDFGYGIKYQNVPKEALSLKEPYILCVDKHHFDYLKHAGADPTIVLHDAIEVRKEVVPLLKKCKKIITIRQEISDYLKEKFDIDSEYKYHPFYPYPISPSSVPKTGAVSVSRIDFDKHTELILEANKSLKSPVKIYGAVNRLYEHFKLKDLNFDRYYKGAFAKSFNSISEIMAPAKFLVDMTLIKNDGGGTQYTFLEAIHNHTALILQRKWVEVGTDFKEGYNCFAVDTPEELAELLRSNPDTAKITKNATKLLKRHVDVNWE